MDCCNPEIVEICSFIFAHPKWKKAFSLTTTKQDVINHVVYHYNRGNVVIAHHATGEIGGVLLYTPNEAEGMLSVNVILATIPGIMKAAILTWHKLYPDCVVYAQRKGKTHIYKPQQFFDKLSSKDVSIFNN